jgi:DNA-nicking Smr family endonuclease
MSLDSYGRAASAKRSPAVGFSRVQPTVEIRYTACMKKIDEEVDLHGYTANEARHRLQSLWATRRWLGMQRVRIIHGTGAVLYRVVREWCDEKAIEWTTEPHNTGVTILHPSRRRLPTHAPAHRPLARHKQVLERFAPQPEPTAQEAPPEKASSVPSTGDPMAAEFERLGKEDPTTLRRRKRGA